MVLADVRRQVESGAVHVAGRLEDEAADGAVGPGTAGEQVQGSDHIHLVRPARVHVERVDACQRVDDGVDAHGAHELADQGVADVELQVIRAAEVIARFADVDPDDLGDVGILDQPLHHERTPPPGHTGHKNAPLPSHEDPV